MLSSSFAMKRRASNRKSTYLVNFVVVLLLEATSARRARARRRRGSAGDLYLAVNDIEHTDADQPTTDQRHRRALPEDCASLLFKHP